MGLWIMIGWPVLSAVFGLWLGPVMAAGMGSEDQ